MGFFSRITFFATIWLRDAKGLALFVCLFGEQKSRSAAQPGAARAEGKPQNKLLIRDNYTEITIHQRQTKQHNKIWVTFSQIKY